MPSPAPERTTRRRFLSDLGRIGALPAGLFAAQVFGQPGRQGDGGGARPGAEDRLLLLGTQGGPNFTPQRGESASALIVEGVVYLVDCGYGTLGALIESGLGYRGVASVFLTHLHDDHTADLAAFLSHQWTGGRIEPTTVYGPAGTAALVDAALEFGEANAAIRLVDEYRTVSPRELVRATEVAAQDSPAAVLEDERVAVTAVENAHYPASSRRQISHRSVSYRFDTAARSVVFSGDTAYSPALVSLARGADVLVCEAMDVAAMRRAFEAMVANGAYADNPEGIWRHIVETHTSTEDAGRMAEEAGVGLLVLNHLIPGALADLPEEAYVAGVRRAFGGNVVVGSDLMEL